MAKSFITTVDKRCTKCNQIELYSPSHSVCSCGGELVPWSENDQIEESNLEHIKGLLRRVSEVEQEINHHLMNLRWYDSKLPLQSKVRILETLIIRSHYLYRTYKKNQKPVCLDQPIA